MHQLKALKTDLLVWNNRCLEILENRRSFNFFLCEELQGLDVIEDDRPLCDDERLKKKTIINDLERTTILEKICWG